MDAGELGSRNLSVNWLEVPPGVSEELRSHEEAEQVYVVVSGTGTMSATGDTQSLGAGDLVLIPPATDHAVANDGDRAAGAGLGAVAGRLRRRALQPPARHPGDRLRRRRRRVASPHVIRRRVIVHGRVQGVFFRDTVAADGRSRAASPARSRNRADGAVEAVFEGDAGGGRGAGRASAAEGPERAAVERVEVFEEEPEGLEGFRDRVDALGTTLRATRDAPAADDRAACPSSAAPSSSSTARSPSRCCCSAPAGCAPPTDGRGRRSAASARPAGAEAASFERRAGRRRARRPRRRRGPRAGRLPAARRARGSPTRSSAPAATSPAAAPDAINLAAKLADGQQVVVPRRAAARRRRGRRARGRRRTARSASARRRSSSSTRSRASAR